MSKRPAEEEYSRPSRIRVVEDDQSDDIINCEHKHVAKKISRSTKNPNRPYYTCTDCFEFLRWADREQPIQMVVAPMRLMDMKKEEINDILAEEKNPDAMAMILKNLQIIQEQQHQLRLEVQELIQEFKKNETKTFQKLY